MRQFRLEELAKQVNGVIHGNPDIIITGISSIEYAKASELTFLTNRKYSYKLQECFAAAILIREEDIKFCRTEQNLIVVADPYLAYALIAQMFDSTPMPATSVDKSAVISSSAQIGKGVAIGANAVISDNVILADNVVIGAGSFIGNNTSIGAASKIWANVSIYHNVSIGENCLIQANTVIGADGFGYANQQGRWIKIPQVGGVRIGNNVEIGASTCIDRGALDDTIIADNVIIDNLCQIAHNVHIGSGTAIAGGTIVAGSTNIGSYCLIGGASVLNGHITICDHVQITGMGMVMRSIDKPGIYSSGIPLQANNKWRRSTALVLKIDELNKKIKELEKKLHN